MANHPNRGPKGPDSNPQPTQIAFIRARAGLTQRQAAELIYATESAWRSWESGLRRMHPGLWELFNLKLKPSARPNIELLKSLGIEIPRGATSYHRNNNKIVFSVNIWPAEYKHFQGQHRFDEVPLTDEQWASIPASASGPGVILEVLDLRGYRGD